MESANFFEIAIAYYKDRVQQKLLEEFHKESILLLQADVNARRTKARENIKAMARLQIELDKFLVIYNTISSKNGRIDAVDTFVSSVQKSIKQLSYIKNNIK